MEATTPYVLVGQHDRDLFEYHVYCTLGPDEHLEFVTPAGEVVATWPDNSRTDDDGVVVARGDRFFHPRDDLHVRVASRSVGHPDGLEQDIRQCGSGYRR